MVFDAPWKTVSYPAWMILEEVEIIAIQLRGYEIPQSVRRCTISVGRLEKIDPDKPDEFVETNEIVFEREV